MISEATKQEIRATIAEGDKTGRWKRSGDREITTKDGTEIWIAWDGIDQKNVIWLVEDGHPTEITDQI